MTKLRQRKRFAIDLDHCKECGPCVAECPSGAMDTVPEE
ncbi:4Fe-4S binding protein [Streptomyces sp. NPDC054940]